MNIAGSKVGRWISYGLTLSFVYFGVVAWVGGCFTSTRAKNELWDPNEDQAIHAETIARSFAIDELKLNHTHLDPMKAVSSGITRYGR